MATGLHHVLLGHSIHLQVNITLWIQQCRITTILTSTEKYLQLYSIILLSVCEGNVVPFKLSDIGEGIREVNVKEW